jgi:DHA1 family multidrug resistance protein-like MFS transporter
MSDLIRDAPIGQLIRFVTKNKLLKYPEEYEDFKCPHSYTKPGDSNDTGDAGDHIEIEKLPTATEPTIDEDRVFEEVEAPQSRASSTTEELEKIPTAAQEEGHLEGIHAQKTTRSQIERVGTRGALQRSRTQAELEAQFTLALQEKGPSVPVLPEVLEDGTILVDWYTTDDPANPQNWTLKKKCFVTWQIW